MRSTSAIVSSSDSPTLPYILAPCQSTTARRLGWGAALAWVEMVEETKRRQDFGDVCNWQGVMYTVLLTAQDHGERERSGHFGSRV